MVVYLCQPCEEFAALLPLCVHTVHMNADELEAARRRRGWSVRELAKRAGVSYSLVSKLETGERQISPAVLKSLEAALAGLDEWEVEEDDGPLGLRRGDKLTVAGSAAWEEGAAVVVSWNGRDVLAECVLHEGVRCMRPAGQRDLVVFVPSQHAVAAVVVSLVRKFTTKVHTAS